MTAKQEIGKRIREARQSKGLSQEALADRIGTSRRHVMRWEKGSNAPRALYRIALAATLDIDRRELIPPREEKVSLEALLAETRAERERRRAAA